MMGIIIDLFLVTTFLLALLKNSDHMTIYFWWTIFLLTLLKNSNYTSPSIFGEQFSFWSFSKTVISPFILGEEFYSWPFSKTVIISPSIFGEKFSSWSFKKQSFQNLFWEKIFTPDPSQTQ